MSSFINISGLAIGLAVCILIFLWIQDEYNYDRFNQKSENIYRVVFSYISNGQDRQHWRTPPPMAATIKESYPEITDAARFHNEGMVLVSVDDQKLKVKAGYTDKSIFDIFTLPFAQGDASNALSKPESAVITSEMAKVFFENENPIGKTISINNQFELTVDGVLEELPSKSHLEFDFLMQFSRLPEVMGYGGEDEWGDFGFNTFILLDKTADIAAVENNTNTCIDEIIPELGRKFYLQPLTKIHLYNLDGSPGMMIYIYIFSSIAVFILLIACINFMNLSTARSMQRSREIGIRKVSGAVRSQLKIQFLGESILLAFIALIFALALVELLLPAFNNLVDKNLELNIIKGNLFLFLVGITAITGIISGSYPALLLSSFKPINIIKGDKLSGSVLFRKVLVVVQFALSVILIFCTIIVSQQIGFIRNKNLGFNKENIVYLPLNNSYYDTYDSFKEELLKNPNVLSVSATSNYVGVSPKWSTTIDKWEGNAGEQEMIVPLISCDKDFLKTFSLELLAGEFYHKDRYSDEEEFEYILNEAAVTFAGIEDPIGKDFANGRIIGVVKNFNYRSLHTAVGPLALVAVQEWHSHVAIKIRGTNVPETMKYIQKISKNIAPDFLFEYTFLDEEFDSLYNEEIRLGKIFQYFAILAIFVSCLGLLGLSSFMIQQRIKEIGIRKVLGSTITQIITLLSVDFTKWILIANIIALPVAYFIMTKWLHNFAYKINIGAGVFLISGLSSIIIALITISFYTTRAANTNPAEIIKYE